MKGNRRKKRKEEELRGRRLEEGEGSGGRV